MAGLAQYSDDDDDIFSSATADPSPAPEPASDPAPRVPADRPADSRLVSEAIRNLQPTSRTVQPVQEQPQPQQQPAPGTPDTSDPTIKGILKELAEERRSRRELEQRLQPQPQPQPEVDIAQQLFENPKGVLENLQQSFATQLASVRLEFDLERASDRHGDTFQQAFQAFMEQVGQGQDRNTYERVMRARSPGEEIVAWYRQNSVLREVGEDPQAYRERIRQELLEEMRGGQPQQQRAPAQQPQRARDNDGRFVQSPRQEVRLPTATSRIPGATSGANDQGEDGSEEAIFESGRVRRR